MPHEPNALRAHDTHCLTVRHSNKKKIYAILYELHIIKVILSSYDSFERQQKQQHQQQLYCDRKQAEGTTEAVKKKKKPKSR